MDLGRARAREQGGLPGAALRRTRHVERGRERKRDGAGSAATRPVERGWLAAQEGGEGRQARAEEGVDRRVGSADPDPVEEDEEDACRVPTPPDGGPR